MTDSQRDNRMFISALLPFAMLAQSCSDNPESVLPAQDVTLKQGETLVVIKREIESCTLEVQASRADNNAIVAKSRELTNSESAFVLQFNEITRAEAITLWAVCRDEQKRIVEMGKTVIAVPSSASTVRFETKRLPVSGSWYRMNPSTTNWQQNAIWTHSSDKGVITGNNGKLRFWNGFGWQEKVYASLDCVNLVDAVGIIEDGSPAIVAGAYDDPKIKECTPTLGFTLNLSTLALVPKIGFNVTINSSLSSLDKYPGVSSVYIYSARSTNYSDRDEFRSDRLWYTQNPNISPDFNVDYKTPIYGKTVSLTISPFLLKKGTTDQPFPYWILTKYGSAHWLWKYPLMTKTTSFEPTMRPDGAREITKMVPGRIVGSRNSNSEATWLIGEGLPDSPIIPVAIALPSAVAYATQDPSSRDQPTALDKNPLNCSKIYTQSSDMNSAYVLCSQPKSPGWLLLCGLDTNRETVSCKSEKLVLPDLDKNETLVGIAENQPDQPWLIGDKGGIWLYQK